MEHADVLYNRTRLLLRSRRFVLYILSIDSKQAITPTALLIHPHSHTPIYSALHITSFLALHKVSYTLGHFSIGMSTYRT
jgi:hypothetical protein